MCQLGHFGLISAYLYYTVLALGFFRSPPAGERTADTEPTSACTGLAPPPAESAKSRRRRGASWTFHFSVRARSDWLLPMRLRSEHGKVCGHGCIPHFLAKPQKEDNEHGDSEDAALKKI